jgi:hypothetical protein
MWAFSCLRPAVSSLEAIRQKPFATEDYLWLRPMLRGFGERALGQSAHGVPGATSFAGLSLTLGLPDIIKPLSALPLESTALVPTEYSQIPTARYFLDPPQVDLRLADLLQPNPEPSL